MKEDFQLYLTPTPIIDSDHRSIREYAAMVLDGSTEPIERAVKLFYAVRDGIWYDPYSPFHLPEHYRASRVLKRGRSFCIPKASLLCALTRSIGIPSRVGFATVRNHLATKQLIDFLGSDVFVYHAFVEMHLEGKWVKATPAFNRGLCARHQVAPIEFDGREDALFQSYNLQYKKYMEYIEYQGSYADIPVAAIVEEWEKFYGKDRVEGWRKMYEEREEEMLPLFEEEEVFSE